MCQWWLLARINVSQEAWLCHRETSAFSGITSSLSVRRNHCWKPEAGLQLFPVSAILVFLLL